MKKLISLLLVFGMLFVAIPFSQAADVEHLQSVVLLRVDGVNMPNCTDVVTCRSAVMAVTNAINSVGFQNGYNPIFVADVRWDVVDYTATWALVAVRRIKVDAAAVDIVGIKVLSDLVEDPDAVLDPLGSGLVGSEITTGSTRTYADLFFAGSSRDAHANINSIRQNELLKDRI